MRLLAHADRRGAAGIGDQEQRAGLHALISAVRRIGERRAARVVVGEHGGQQIRRGRAHAVEQRKIAVAMPEETQHRHHAIDGVEQCRRRRHVAGGERLLERQEIEQELDQSRGIAADVAAVRQDLPLQSARPWPAAAAARRACTKACGANNGPGG